MPTIMCTRRLWNAIGGGGALPRRGPAEPRFSLLGAWSAGEVPTRAGHLVVAIEESTYLTAVCPLVRLPAFVRVFAASVGAALEDLGVSTDAAEREVMAIVEGVTFARNDNRSLLGSATDVAWHASILLERARVGDLSALARVQRELNDMPHVNRQPPFPSQAVRFLFHADPSVH